MGTRKKQEAQERFWLARAALLTGAGHPFYQWLNQLLEENGFDRFVEDLCRRYYVHTLGRPSLAPGVRGFQDRTGHRLLRKSLSEQHWGLFSFLN
jgi:hypothetical protein